MPYFRSEQAPAYGRRNDSNGSDYTCDHPPTLRAGVSSYVRHFGAGSFRDVTTQSTSYSPYGDRSSTGEVAYSTAIGDVIVAPEKRQRFPSRQRLLAANPHSLRDIELHFSRAPWWDALAIGDREMIAYYTNENGFLPDGLPGSIVDSYDFNRRCLVPSSDLRSRSGGRMAWYRHIRDVYARSARMPCGDPIPRSFGVDMYCYRTYGEVEYVFALTQLEVHHWRDVFGVAQGALCFARPLLRADFRYESKSGNAYWTWVKWACRMQRNDGLLVSYHCVEYQNLRIPRRASRYPRVPPRFWEIDLPTHCYVDQPPCLAYVGSKLMAPQSGWWLVYYTERTAKAACFILWDVYDRHKLWRVPKRLIQWMRSLDLALVLGSPLNVEDLAHLLDVIEDTDWTTGEVMDTQEGGTHSRPVYVDEDDGVVEEGEFVWYDPWMRERIDAGVAKERRLAINRPAKPDGHPIEYTYNPALPPLAVQRMSWARCNVPTIPASYFYEEDNGVIVYAGAPVNRRSGMLLDHRASKQRRIPDTLSHEAARASSALLTPTDSIERAGALLVRPDQASTDTFARLRDQLDAVLRQRRQTIVIRRGSDTAEARALRSPHGNGGSPLMAVDVDVEHAIIESPTASSFDAREGNLLNEASMAEVEESRDPPIPVAKGGIDCGPAESASKA